MRMGVGMGVGVCVGVLLVLELGVLGVLLVRVLRLGVEAVEGAVLCAG